MDSTKPQDNPKPKTIYDLKKSDQIEVNDENSKIIKNSLETKASTALVDPKNPPGRSEPNKKGIFATLGTAALTAAGVIGTAIGLKKYSEKKALEEVQKKIANAQNNADAFELAREYVLAGENGKRSYDVQFNKEPVEFETDSGKISVTGCNITKVGNKLDLKFSLTGDQDAATYRFELFRFIREKLSFDLDKAIKNREVENINFISDGNVEVIANSEENSKYICRFGYEKENEDNIQFVFQADPEKVNLDYELLESKVNEIKQHIDKNSSNYPKTKFIVKFNAPACNGPFFGEIDLNNKTFEIKQNGLASTEVHEDFKLAKWYVKQGQDGERSFDVQLDKNNKITTRSGEINVNGYKVEKVNGKIKVTFNLTGQPNAYTFWSELSRITTISLFAADIERAYKSENDIKVLDRIDDKDKNFSVRFGSNTTDNWQVYLEPATGKDNIDYSKVTYNSLEKPIDILIAGCNNDMVNARTGKTLIRIRQDFDHPIAVYSISLKNKKLRLVDTNSLEQKGANEFYKEYDAGESIYDGYLKEALGEPIIGKTYVKKGPTNRRRPTHNPNDKENPAPQGQNPAQLPAQNPAPQNQTEDFIKNGNFWTLKKPIKFTSFRNEFEVVKFEIKQYKQYKQVYVYVRGKDNTFYDRDAAKNATEAVLKKNGLNFLLSRPENTNVKCLVFFKVNFNENNYCYSIQDNTLYLKDGDINQIKSIAQSLIGIAVKERNTMSKSDVSHIDSSELEKIVICSTGEEIDVKANIESNLMAPKSAPAPKPELAPDPASASVPPAPDDQTVQSGKGHVIFNLGKGDNNQRLVNFEAKDIDGKVTITFNTNSMENIAAAKTKLRDNFEKTLFNLLLSGEEKIAKKACKKIDQQLKGEQLTEKILVNIDVKEDNPYFETIKHEDGGNNSENDSPRDDDDDNSPNDGGNNDNGNGNNNDGGNNRGNGGGSNSSNDNQKPNNISNKESDKTSASAPAQVNNDTQANAKAFADAKKGVETGPTKSKDVKFNNPIVIETDSGKIIITGYNMEMDGEKLKVTFKLRAKGKKPVQTFNFELYRALREKLNLENLDFDVHFKKSKNIRLFERGKSNNPNNLKPKYFRYKFGSDKNDENTFYIFNIEDSGQLSYNNVKGSIDFVKSYIDKESPNYTARSFDIKIEKEKGKYIDGKIDLGAGTLTIGNKTYEGDASIDEQVLAPQDQNPAQLPVQNDEENQVQEAPAPAPVPPAPDDQTVQSEKGHVIFNLGKGDNNQRLVNFEAKDVEGKVEKPNSELTIMTQDSNKTPARNDSNNQQALKPMENLIKKLGPNDQITINAENNSIQIPENLREGFNRLIANDQDSLMGIIRRAGINSMVITRDYINLFRQNGDVEQLSVEDLQNMLQNGSLRLSNRQALSNEQDSAPTLEDTNEKIAQASNDNSNDHDASEPIKVFSDSDDDSQGLETGEQELSLEILEKNPTPSNTGQPEVSNDVKKFNELIESFKKGTNEKTSEDVNFEEQIVFETDQIKKITVTGYNISKSGEKINVTFKLTAENAENGAVLYDFDLNRIVIREKLKIKKEEKPFDGITLPFEAKYECSNSNIKINHDYVYMGNINEDEEDFNYSYTCAGRVDLDGTEYIDIVANPEYPVVSYSNLAGCINSIKKSVDTNSNIYKGKKFVVRNWVEYLVYGVIDLDEKNLKFGIIEDRSMTFKNGDFIEFQGDEVIDFRDKNIEKFAMDELSKKTVEWNDFKPERAYTEDGKTFTLKKYRYDDKGKLIVLGEGEIDAKMKEYIGIHYLSTYLTNGNYTDWDIELENDENFSKLPAPKPKPAEPVPAPKTPPARANLDQDFTVLDQDFTVDGNFVILKKPIKFDSIGNEFQVVKFEKVNEHDGIIRVHAYIDGMSDTFVDKNDYAILFPNVGIRMINNQLIMVNYMKPVDPKKNIKIFSFSDFKENEKTYGYFIDQNEKTIYLKEKIQNIEDRELIEKLITEERKKANNNLFEAFTADDVEKIVICSTGEVINVKSNSESKSISSNSAPAPEPAQTQKSDQTIEFTSCGKNFKITSYVKNSDNSYSVNIDGEQDTVVAEEDIKEALSKKLNDQDLEVKCETDRSKNIEVKKFEKRKFLFNYISDVSLYYIIHNDILYMKRQDPNNSAWTVDDNRAITEAKDIPDKIFTREFIIDNAIYKAIDLDNNKTFEIEDRDLFVETYYTVDFLGAVDSSDLEVCFDIRKRSDGQLEIVLYREAIKFFNSNLELLGGLPVRISKLSVENNYKNCFAIELKNLANSYVSADTLLRKTLLKGNKVKINLDLNKNFKGRDFVTDFFESSLPERQLK